MVQMVGRDRLRARASRPSSGRSRRAGKLDNGVLVAGYVVMRVAMVAQWLARGGPGSRPPPHRPDLHGPSWVSQAAWMRPGRRAAVGALGFFALRRTAVRVRGGLPGGRRAPVGGTPWNPLPHRRAVRAARDHRARRGDHRHRGAVSALVRPRGLDARRRRWSGVAGAGITFGLWWTYFLVPSGEILARHRERSFVWGYGQMVVLGAIAATGAGLHVAASVIEGHAEIGVTGAIVSVAVPAVVFSVTLFALRTYLLQPGRRVPHRPRRRVRRDPAGGDRPCRRGRADRAVPRGRHRRARGRRGRLRDASGTAAKPPPSSEHSPSEPGTRGRPARSPHRPLRPTARRPRSGR